METAWGRRVSRKSSSTSNATPAMLTAHRVGVPMEAPAAGSAAAATRVWGSAVVMGFLGRVDPSKVSFTAPVGRGAVREHHGVLVLTGAAQGSTPLVVHRVPARGRPTNSAGCPPSADKADS